MYACAGVREGACAKVKRSGDCECWARQGGFLPTRSDSARHRAPEQLGDGRATDIALQDRCETFWVPAHTHKQRQRPLTPNLYACCLVQ